LSSVDELFDVIFLGIFVNLSPAFDRRFYGGKIPDSVADEASYAISCFVSIQDVFMNQYFILLDGPEEAVPVLFTYVYDRMFAEFAAAAVVFSKACRENQPEDYNDGNGEYGVTYTEFREDIERLIQLTNPDALPYYSRCVDGLHKDFLWSGPEVHIFPRSDDVMVLKRLGEVHDFPSHLIYSSPEEPKLTIVIPPAGKRQEREESDDDAGDQRKKRRS
jgi:hypothetical protein